MFWEILEQLRGASTGLPGHATVQGREVVFRLAESPQGRSLKDLYRASRFSEPTARRALHRLVDEGFVVLRVCDDDLRQSAAVPTPKLLAALAAYQALFAKASASASAPSPLRSSFARAAERPAENGNATPGFETRQAVRPQHGD